MSIEVQPARADPPPVEAAVHIDDGDVRVNSFHIGLGAVVGAVAAIAGDTQHTVRRELIIEAGDPSHIGRLNRLKALLVAADNPVLRAETGRVQAVD